MDFWVLPWVEYLVSNGRQVLLGGIRLGGSAIGCTKNQHDKVTQFREPSYGDATASESSGAEEKGNGKAKYDEEVNTDAYPTHANFAQMLIDERKLHSNNLQHLSNLL